jgi:transcriptional regulator with XRE-family HTH domain
VPQTTPDVAGNVRAELARRHITRNELGQAIGMHRESLARRLRDQTEFTVGELTTIANYLDIPVCQLIDGAAS